MSSHRQPNPSANGRRKRHSTANDVPSPQSPLWGAQPRRRFPSSSSPGPAGEDDGQSARKRRRQSGRGDEQFDENGESSPPPLGDGSDDSSVVDYAWWKSKGSILGRCGEMWDNIYQILNQGVSRDPNVDEDYLHTELQNQQYKKFLVLIEISPTLVKLLGTAKDKKTGQELARQLDIAIDAGRKQVRRIDVNGIRGAIGLWPSIHWDPAYPAVRCLLGFNHNTSGELLCPVTLNWGDHSVRERLRRGAQAITTADHPSFLWPEGDFDIEDIYRGFLRGKVLVTAYKHVFISPSSAKDIDRSKRGGNAFIHDISFVTYESIAYIATLTRYALSDEMTFSQGGRDTEGKGKAGFPHRQFYRELLEHKELMLKEELEDLIEWWNEMVFPQTEYATDTIKEDSAGGIMRAQAKAKRLARDAAAASAAQAEAEEETDPGPVIVKGAGHLPYRFNDETIHKNYEDYGHPDGRQEPTAGIVLPPWIVEAHNNVRVLSLYSAIFGVGLPPFVGNWWFGSRSKTKDGVFTWTATNFWKALTETSDIDDVVPALCSATVTGDNDAKVDCI
ncbi:hypothetical protein EDB85DRAFT_2197736 [Lactarius pseudohatsudake]|nr:hypothetical protein EDB85DRAFT_2197736 [Lactarius pseudohatsudake]